MDMIPRNDYGEQCQFDAYCKLVLYHEAIDYLWEMQRRRDRGTVIQRPSADGDGQALRCRSMPQ